MNNGMEISCKDIQWLSPCLWKLIYLMISMSNIWLPFFFHLCEEKLFPQGLCILFPRSYTSSAIGIYYLLSHFLNYSTWLFCSPKYENDLIECLYMFFSEISETSESLKTKMSELRLYCDLLMQQVHTIQEFVHHDENHSSPSIEV